MVEVVKEMHPRLPTLYLIPKIHKNAMDPPGRPIVSGNGVLCEVVTMVIDHYLKPLLTYKAGRNVEFLDLSIKIDEQGSLFTDLFRKPTATNSFLHATSAHPPATIRGIPVGQFLRAKRICTNPEDFNSQSADLSRRFLERGYSKRNIKRGYQRALKTNRNDLLYKQMDKSGSSDNKKNGVRFITTYHNKWHQFTDILQRHWKILCSDPILKEILPERPMFHSLYSPVGDAKSISSTNSGFYPCGLCKACRNHTKSKTFSNFNNIKIYTIRKRITCASRGVIYHASCPCNKVYIGLTTRELKIRTREHCRDIVNAKTTQEETPLKTLPRHFKQHHQCNPHELKIKGIDLVELGIRGGNLSKQLA
ncbi:unnamed protein product [Ranitomeya imitator]|uniref:Helix-turn-helix domain-containing protein n=1 Tax=Ranitomeya imitator TaxID=111125 RepID=A0ABN9KWK4_9NEOB|nr:unnamed protein product [Ranitomeya imitator]